MIVDPHALSKGKPDPEIFLTAANLIDVLPNKAIGFEDLQVGIEALNRANIFSVDISPKDNLVGADLRVDPFEKINFEQLLSM
ncbi:MAG: HAD-IA family hydrolase [Candidatus Phlomobacter fragariae]